MSVKWGLPIFGGPADRPRSPSPVCTERVEDLSDSGGLACKSSVSTCVVVADVHREYERSSESDGDSEPSEISEASDAIRCAGVRNAAIEREEDASNRSIPETVRIVDQVAARGPAPDTVLPWSKEGLRKSQMEDADIGCVIDILEEKSGKPPWEAVAMKSHDVKTLWGM